MSPASFGPQQGELFVRFVGGPAVDDIIAEIKIFRHVDGEVFLEVLRRRKIRCEDSIC